MPARKPITQAQALKEFKSVYADFLKKHKTDKPAKSERWVAWIDFLVRQGYVTEKRAHAWGNPFYR